MPRNGCVYLLIVQVNVVSSTRRITFTFGAEPRTMNHERQCCLPNCYVIGVYRCSGCQSAYYCCHEHQHLDWERHKLGCYRDSGDNGDFGLLDGGSVSTRRPSASAAGASLNAKLLRPGAGAVGAPLNAGLSLAEREGITQLREQAIQRVGTIEMYMHCNTCNSTRNRCSPGQ